jgi:uncharacterized FAD-dependent dehydrogenase
MTDQTPRRMCEIGRCARNPHFESNARKPATGSYTLGGKNYLVCRTCADLMRKERSLRTRHPSIRPLPFHEGIGNTVPDPEAEAEASRLRQKEALRKLMRE